MKREVAQLPNNLAQWMPVILSILVATVIFLAGIGMVQHQVDEQFINDDVLKQSLEQLNSYSQEGTLLARYTLTAGAPKPYTAAYASALQGASDSLGQKLQEHPHDRSLNGKVRTTIKLADTLARQFDNLASQPRSQLSSTLPKQLGQISDRLQELESQL